MDGIEDAVVTEMLSSEVHIESLTDNGVLSSFDDFVQVVCRNEVRAGTPQRLRAGAYVAGGGFARILQYVLVNMSTDLEVRLNGGWLVNLAGCVAETRAALHGDAIDAIALVTTETKGHLHYRTALVIGKEKQVAGIRPANHWHFSVRPAVSNRTIELIRLGLFATPPPSPPSPQNQEEPTEEGNPPS